MTNETTLPSLLPASALAAGDHGDGGGRLLDTLAHYPGWVLLGLIVLAFLVFGFRDLLRLSWRRIWAISGVCFDESIRRRVLWITPLAILGVIAVSQLTKPVDAQDAIRQTTKFCVFASGLVVAITAIILACTNLPKEIENRVIYTIVTKPTTRLEIVLGKVIGFARVSAAILLIMGLFTYGYLHLRANRMEAGIRTRLQSEPQDSVARPALEQYAAAGLLNTKAIEQPVDLQIFARMPEDKPGAPAVRHVGGAQGQYFLVPFSLTDQEADAILAANQRGAGIFLITTLGYEQHTPDESERRQIEQMQLPTHENPTGVPMQPTTSSSTTAPTTGATTRASDPNALPIPQIQVVLNDRNMNALVAEQEYGGRNIMSLPPAPKPGAAVTAPLPLPPAALQQIVDQRDFFVQVTARTPAVDYAIGEMPVVISIMEPGGQGSMIRPAMPADGGGHPDSVAAGTPPRPRFLTQPGRAGMQLMGRDDGKGPVALFRFDDAELGKPTGGTEGDVVTFEVRSGVDRTGEAHDDPASALASLQVRNRATGQLSQPVQFIPEPTQIAYVRVPRAAFAGADPAAADFDVLIRGLTSAHNLGFRESSLALATGDRSFGFNLFKGLLILWLMAVLIVSISVFCSTFVSWPIAVVLTLVILLGRWGVEQLGDANSPALGTEISGQLGLNPIQARLVRGTVNTLTSTLNTVATVLPDISRFAATEDIERGVSIPARKITEPLLVVLGYGMPMVVLAYLVLKRKEVAP